MDKDSKIFVAGGTGMVGSAIIRKLLQDGYTNIVSNYHRRPPAISELVPVDFHRVDLTNQAETERFFQEQKPQYVFLAAAKVGGILANDTYKAEFIYENIAIAANVIHASFRYNVSKLLNLGSSCIYPKFAPQPLKEEYLLTGPLETTNEPYALAKIAAIKLCRYYNEQYGTNFISVMPTNLYGPYDNFDLYTSHVLPALIRKFHLGKSLEGDDWEAIRHDLIKNPIEGIDGRASQKEILAVLSKYGIKGSASAPEKPSVTVELWGTGEVYREFLHVDDLADSCLFLMEKVNAWDLCRLYPKSDPAPKRIESELEVPDYFLNVGSGTDLKIKDLSNLIKIIVGFSGEIRQDPTKPDGTPKKLLDISKITRLGWRPKIGLEEGIKKTYEWYLSSGK